MKIPVYKQDTPYGCGSACLKMILHYHHRNVSMQDIKYYAKETKVGVSVYGMISCLNHYQIKAKAYHCPYEKIDECTNLPFIAFLIDEQLTHYVVVTKICKDSIWIHDPKCGKIEVTKKIFEEKYKNIVIMVEHVGIYATDKVDKPYITFLLEFALKHRYALTKLIIASVIIASTSIVSSYYFQIFIDNYQQYTNITFIAVTAFFVFVALIKIYSSYLKSTIQLQLRKECEQEYILYTMQHVFHQTIAMQNMHETGSYLLKIQQLYPFLQQVMETYQVLFVDVIFLVIILCTLFYTSLFIGGIIFLTMLVLIISGIYIFKHIKVIEKEFLMKQDMLQNAVVESLDNRILMQQYSRVRFFKQKLQHFFLQQQVIELKKDMLLVKVQAGLEVILQSLLFIVITYGFFQLGGQYTIGKILFTYMLVSFSIEPIMKIIVTFSSHQEQWLIYERYKQLLPKRVKKGKRIGKIVKIEFGYVSYGYGYGVCILENTNFIIDSNVHLKGEIGCGKSTALKLILGYDDVQKGEIRINDIPLSKIDMKSLYRRIIYIEKVSSFFNETIAFNMHLGIEKSIKRLEMICKDLEVDILYKQKDYILDSKGSGLSSGQLQMVMIIRALLIEPDVLILDEACSNLSSHQTNLILEYIHKHFSMIVVFVGHQTNIVNVKYDCAIMSARKIKYGE